MCYNSRRAVKSLQGRELQAQGTGQHKMRRFIFMKAYDMQEKKEVEVTGEELIRLQPPGGFSIFRAKDR